jgi:hypothetical protein
MDKKKVDRYTDMIKKYFTFISVLNDMEGNINSDYESPTQEGSARVIEEIEPLLLKKGLNE